MTQITVTTGSLTPADLATNRLTSVTQTPGPVVTGSIIPADIATDRLTQTPVIKASITPTPPTDMSDTESSSEDGGVSTAVFAGVGGMVVVIIALILLVILLIVILVRKNRNHKDNSIKNDRYVNSCMRCPLLFVNRTSRILVHIDRWLTRSMALLWK